MIPTDGLTESAQKSLRYVAELLRRGYSGPIELHCQQGGVRSVRGSWTFTPTDAAPPFVLDLSDS